MNNEEKILAMLSQMQTDMADMKADMTDMKADMVNMKADITDVKATQAEQDERLRKIEMNIEHTIIPRLDTLDERQRLMQETLARKEDIEELKDAMAEWETANHAAFTEMWGRVAKPKKKAE